MSVDVAKHDLRQILCLDSDGLPFCPPQRQLDDAENWLPDHVNHIKARASQQDRYAINAVADYLRPHGRLDLDRFRNLLERSSGRCNWSCCPEAHDRRAEPSQPQRRKLWNLNQEPASSYFTGASPDFVKKTRRLQLYPFEEVKMELEKQRERRQRGQLGKGHSRKKTWAPIDAESALKALQNTADLSTHAAPNPSPAETTSPCRALCRSPSNSIIVQGPASPPPANEARQASHMHRDPSPSSSITVVELPVAERRAKRPRNVSLEPREAPSLEPWSLDILWRALRLVETVLPGRFVIHLPGAPPDTRSRWHGASLLLPLQTGEDHWILGVISADRSDAILYHTRPDDSRAGSEAVESFLSEHGRIRHTAPLLRRQAGDSEVLVAVLVYYVAAELEFPPAVDVPFWRELFCLAPPVAPDFEPDVSLGPVMARLDPRVSCPAELPLSELIALTNRSAAAARFDVADILASAESAVVILTRLEESSRQLRDDAATTRAKAMIRQARRYGAKVIELGSPLKSRLALKHPTHRRHPPSHLDIQGPSPDILP